MPSLEELKTRARAGDADALRELRASGFFEREGRPVSYPVSDAQRRLWVLDQMNPESSAYNIPGAWRLSGDLEVEALGAALAFLESRHESLRTGIVAIDGEPRQVIEPARRLRLAHRDLRADVDPASAAREAAAAEAATPFALDRPPLCRATLVTLSAGEHLLLFTIHHIVCDAWSLDLLLREWVAAYDRIATGGGPAPAPLRIQYKDYAAWRRDAVGSDSFAAARRYWLDRFEMPPPALELPTDQPRPAVQSFRGADVTDEVSVDTLAGLERLGARHGATLFMTLLAALRVLLYRYTAQRDVVIGTPVSGRTHPDLEEQVGFYVNLLPLRDVVSSDATFAALLDQTRETAGAAYTHQDYPFDRLVDELDLPRDLSRSPLFDVLLSLEEEAAPVLVPQGLRVGPFEHAVEVAKYDLTFFFTRAGGALRWAVNYNTRLFRRDRIELLARHLNQLLGELVAGPDLALRDVPMMSAPERERVTGSLAGTTSAYPSTETIARVVARQASSRPDAVAVRGEGEAGEAVELTYAELLGQADAVAGALRAAGVGLEDRVGVLTTRSPALAVALLGVLKTGAAYVPLDPTYPARRLDAIVEDAMCRVVLGESVARDAATWMPGASGEHGPTWLELEAVAAGPAETTPLSGDGRTLAYVMYTSGSTGTPKGTLIEHRSVLRLVLATEYLQLGPTDRVLQTGAPGFDASTLEIWGPLLTGGCVCFAPGDALVQPDRLRALIERHGVTVMWVTASLLNQLVERDTRVFTGLRALLTGGERLSVWHMNRLRRRHPDLTLINGYGPTENTTFTSCHRIEGTSAGEVPIGRPVTNTTVYVLDDRGGVCPLGVPGEICTGGDGLARGYLNAPALTADRFVPDPVEPGARVYRTGDRGRWRPDGVLEFLGRLDSQVKVRGFRIEPGEIETALLGHPAVAQAAVLGRRVAGGTTELVAYLAPNPSEGLAAVRAHLVATLPPYMMPSRFVPLDRMPMLSSGKIDRTALGRTVSTEAARRVVEPPRTDLERTLRDIWAEALDVSDLGIHDDVFERGAHSLKAARVLTRIQAAVGGEVSLRDLFVYATVASLAEHITPTAPTAPIRPVPDAADYPASHAQRRLRFQERLSGHTGAYNVPAALVLDGDVDVAALGEAFTRLVARHESLRTAVIDVGTEVRQRVIGAFAVEVPVVDLCAEADPEAAARRSIAEDAAEPFDLARAPLFRVCLLRLGPDRQVLSLNLHHIVTDGWSMRVLLDEGLSLYQAIRDGAPDPLPPLPIQYRDYAEWQLAALAGEAAAVHRRYWLEALDPTPPPLDLPADRDRPPLQSFRGATVGTRLAPDVGTALRALGRAEGATPYMVVLALVRLLIYRYTGQEWFALGMPVSGREHADLERQVGFFVNILPLVARVESDDTFRSLLRRTRDEVTAALSHQGYPFDRLVDDLRLPRHLGRSPLFDVVVTQEEGEPPARPGLASGPFDIPAPFSKFDLTVAVTWSAENSLLVTLEYCTDLFHADRMRGMAGHLETLCHSVVAHAEAPVSDLRLLSPVERSLLTGELAGTAAAYPSGLTIADVFARQVAARPVAVAVRELAPDGAVTELTYAALDAEADGVAAALRASGVGLEDRVGVLAERSAGVAVALLAVLKAGAAYVPLDPAYPARRLDFMTRDAGCRVIVGDARVRARVGWPADPAPAPGPVWVDLTASEAGAAGPAPSGDGRTLAYVMYTSGSTGDPKGVLVEHRSVLRLVLAASYLELGVDDRLLQTGSLGFDASTLEVWGALLNGGTVCFAPGDTLLRAPALRAAIEQLGVTVMWVTASLLNQLVESDEPTFERLRVLLTGGERLSVSHMAALRTQFPGLTLINGYGPTENTTFTACHHIDEVGPGEIPIGRPVTNTTVYLLDDRGGLCPVGVPGELCTGGDGLARGYLNAPGLTAERFVPHPALSGARVYRTGDRGRWRLDGMLEYLGRRDAQVKVRGFRIEPGEVEARLLVHPAVSSAAVVARRTTVGTWELAAYYTGDGETPVSTLTAHLAETLPSHMLPAELACLPALPLTRSGKVDRRRLAERQADRGEREREPPRTEPERLLARVWEGVLAHPGVARTDDYFALGGDSIRAIQVVNRLRRDGWALDVRELFHHPVLSAAARRLTPIVEPAPVPAPAGPAPLTPIQHWFFGHSGDLSHFNHSVLLRCGAPVAGPALEAAVAALVAHHVALRLVVRGTSGARAMVELPTDPGHAAGGLALTVRDLRASPPERWRADMEALQRSFDLDQGPLFRAVLYQLADGDRVLLLAHHLIVDGVSWRVLIEDLEQAYDAALAGSRPALTPQAAGYVGWARALAERAETGAWDADRRFWEQACRAPAALVPRDRQTAENRYGDCRVVELTLTPEATRAAVIDAHAALNTGVEDLLLVTLARAVRWVYGHDATWIALEGHGRDSVADLDVGGAVGWFTALFPFRLCAEGHDPGDQLRRVKEAVRQSRRHALGYGVLRWLCPEGGLDPDATPECRLSVNYMGQLAVDGGPGGSGRFTVSDEYAGNPISESLTREHDIDVGAVVRHDRLTLSLTYSTGLHDEVTVQRLLDQIDIEVRRLSAWCAARGHVEKTPADFTACPLPLARYDEILATHGWARDAVSDVYPLSPMQAGLLFETLVDPTSRAYYLQLSYRLRGALDVDRFRDALHAVARRHPIVRTAILHERLDDPLQVVLRDRLPEVTVDDLSGLTEDATAARIREWQRRDLERGFDLARQPLMRVGVLRLAPDRHHVVWSYHHLLLDGWSLGLVYRDFRLAYVRGPGADAPEPAVPFADYVRWLGAQDTVAAVEYWRRYLDGFEGTTGVPALARAGVAGSSDAHRLVFTSEVTGALARVAATLGVTLNTLVQTCWAVLLARYNDRADVLFGAVVSGRPAALAGVEEMVGLFINTVPVRVCVDEAEPFASLAGRVQQSALEGEGYHFLPLADAQMAGAAGRDLFDHLLIFENYPVEREVDPGDAGAGALEVDSFDAHDRTHYALDVTIVPGERLEVRFTFDTAVYESGQIERVAADLDRVAALVVERPGRFVSELELVASSVRTIDAAADDARPHIEWDAGVTTLVDLFQRCVNGDGERPAMLWDDGEISYAALDRETDRLAARLREVCGVGRETRVGIALPRSPAAAGAVLAIMKSGGCYVPVDPAYPTDRQRFIAEDADIDWMITPAAEDGPWGAGRVEGALVGTPLVVRASGRRPVAVRVPPAGDARPHPGDLVYIIYTSGSTGRPKGVMVEHAGLATLAGALRHAYALDTFDVRVLQLASLSFDVSAGDLARAWPNGGALVFCPDDARGDPAALNAVLAAHRVSVLEGTPAVVFPLMDYVRRAGLALDCLKVLVVGSEACSADQFEALVRQVGPGLRVVNSYGVTEATVDSSCHAGARRFAGATMPIGRPLDGVAIEILDRRQRPVPIGIEGEICIAGAGVARGYVGAPGLTADRFRPDPASPGRRQYHTADRGRWFPDGALEYLGRRDRQLKIRGYRIESGEVESRLREVDGVDAVVVGVRRVAGDDALVAWVVGETSPVDLRAFLLARVPEFLVPSFFVPITEVPVTSQGKVDHAALPGPDVAAGGTRRYLAPETELQRRLAEIWREVLQVTRVGLHDRFFELGGHSLKAMQVASRVRRDLDRRVSLGELMSHQSLADLAGLLETAGAADLALIEQAPAQADYALSHAQARLWLQHELEAKVAYNMPEALVIDEHLDVPALSRAFADLVARHEALRTAFIVIDGAPRQRVLERVEASIRQVDLTGDADAKATARRLAADEAAVAFDLARPPLLRAVLYRLAPTRHVFLLVMHHIVGDGWSMNVLYRELLALYAAHRSGAPSPLPALPLQYKDFAVWQNRQDFSADERFWVTALDGAPDRVSLPYDHAPEGGRDFAGRTAQLRVSRSTTDRLRGLASAHETTLSTIVLTLFFLYLYQWTRQDDLCVGVSVANRNHPAIERLIGFFVNILPVRVRLSDQLELAELIKTVRDQSTAAFEHQDYPFDLLVRRLRPARVANRQPILNVIYAYQNFEDVTIDLGVRAAPAPATPSGDPMPVVPARSGSEGIRPFAVPFETAKFDVTLFVTEMGDELELSLEYDTSLFEDRTAQRTLETLRRFADMAE